MTPTSYKVSMLDKEQKQLSEQERHNAAVEREQRRGNTLNFVSNLIGSAVGLGSSAISAGGKIASAKIGASAKKLNDKQLALLSNEFEQLVNQRKVGRLTDDKFARLKELAAALGRKY